MHVFVRERLLFSQINVIFNLEHILFQIPKVPSADNLMFGLRSRFSEKWQPEKEKEEIEKKNYIHSTTPLGTTHNDYVPFQI